jgi:hypothetical protein
VLVQIKHHAYQYSVNQQGIPHDIVQAKHDYHPINTNQQGHERDN